MHKFPQPLSDGNISISLLILGYLDTRFLQHLRCQGIGIAVLENDVLHAGVDDHLRADAAGLIGTIEGRTVNIRPMLGSLDDCILLGMKTTADFVSFPGWDSHLFAKTSAVEAMLDARGCTVVARGENVLVLHDHSAHLATQAGGPLLHQMRDFHEIFVP